MNSYWYAPSRPGFLPVSSRDRFPDALHSSPAPIRSSQMPKSLRIHFRCAPPRCSWRPCRSRRPLPAHITGCPLRVCLSDQVVWPPLPSDSRLRPLPTVLPAADPPISKSRLFLRPMHRTDQSSVRRNFSSRHQSGTSRMRRRFPKLSCLSVANGCSLPKS